MGMFKRQSLITYLLCGYLLVIVLFMLSRNMAMTPDRIFVVLLFAAFILGRGRSFLKDWTPFIGLLIGYELLRGFADTAGFHVNVENLVNLERGLFGFIPSEELQRRFFDPNNIHWYDIGAVLIDFLHFPLPLIAAFYFWMKDRHQYWKFLVALMTLSFAGFVTYLVFPAAPPWYAAQKLHLINVSKVVDFVVSDIGWGWDFSQIYNKLNPNQVAAMPSLHSAYPWLCFLALRQYNKKLSWFFLPYPILVWASVVYLGEHYVIDVIAGVTYATIAYLLVYRSKRLRSFIVNFIKSKRSSEVKSKKVVGV